MLSHLEYWINKPHFRFNCLPLKSFFQSFSRGKQCRDRNFPVHSLCTSVLFPLKTKFGNNPVNGPFPNGRCLPGNELGLLGRFPFDQIFRFEIPGIPWDEWNSIFRLVGLTNPKSCTKFRAKRRTLLPLFTCLLDDSEVEINDVFWWGWQYNFYRKNFKMSERLY